MLGDLHCHDEGKQVAITTTVAVAERYAESDLGLADASLVALAVM
jgi:hypothetical protein